MEVSSIKGYSNIQFSSQKAGEINPDFQTNISTDKHRSHKVIKTVVGVGLAVAAAVVLKKNFSKIIELFGKKKPINLFHDTPGLCTETKKLKNSLLVEQAKKMTLEPSGKTNYEWFEELSAAFSPDKVKRVPIQRKHYFG